MEVKKCTKCDELKPLDDFFFKNKSLNKRRADCKDCCRNNRNYASHYQKYKAEYNERSKKRRQRLLSENRVKLLNYLKEHPCVECGESNPIVLEFDHLEREKKEYGISNMMSDFTWSQILKEIDKCEVVCSNCHKIRTAKEFGWFKYIESGQV